MQTKTLFEELEENHRKQKEAAKWDAVVIALCIVMTGIFWAWRGITYGFSFNETLSMVGATVFLSVAGGVFFWKMA